MKDSITHYKDTRTVKNASIEMQDVPTDWMTGQYKVKVSYEYGTDDLIDHVPARWVPVVSNLQFYTEEGAEEFAALQASYIQDEKR